MTDSRGRFGRHAPLCVLVFGLVNQAGYSQANPPTTERVRLTLSRQTVWQGTYGWCTFTAELVSGKGAVSQRCGGAGPFGTAPPAPHAGSERRRALTDAETSTLSKLYGAARLFDGDYVGKDLGAGDLPFEMLIVRTTNRAGVLVTLGNPSFANGPRRALIDWLWNANEALIEK